MLLTGNTHSSAQPLCLPVPCRMTCLSAICLTQAWMMWKFINFQLKKWREQSQTQASKKKTVSPKMKPSKKDSSRGKVPGCDANKLVYSILISILYLSCFKGILLRFCTALLISIIVFFKWFSLLLVLFRRLCKWSDEARWQDITQSKKIKSLIKKQRLLMWRRGGPVLVTS